MESLEGKLNKLNSAWQSFATNTVNSDFVKGLLDIATSFLKIADAAGGLVPILTTLVSTFALLKAGSIAKGISDIKTKFDDFGKTINILGGGFKGFQLALAGVEKAEDAAKISTLGLATAAQTLISALGIIGIVIGVVTTAYNLFTNAQKEANEAAVKESQEAREKIQEKEEEKQKIEEQTEALINERDAYIKNVEAKGKDTKNDEFIKSKNLEISKRQENIEKIQEEIDKANLQRKAAAKSFNPQGAQGAGISRPELGLEGLFDSRLMGIIGNVNKQLEGLEGNVGAYHNKLVEVRDEYQKQADKVSTLNGNTELYDKVIRQLNDEINRQSERYEEAKKQATELYNMQKDGIDISSITLENGENALEFIKKFFNLNESQIKQLKEGKDVLQGTAEALEEESNKLEEAINKSSNAQQKYDGIINDSIDEVASYSDNLSILTEAQDMLTNSGHLTAEMYQQLSNNNLLQYLDVVNGKLTVNKDAFDNSSQAALDNATQAAKDSLAQQLLQIALADQNGTLDETAKKLGLVSSESNGVDTKHAVDELLKIGAAAGSSKTELGALFKTMEDGKEVDANYTPSSKAQELMNQAINRTNAQIAAIQSISLGSFKSSKSSGGGGKGKKSGSSKSAKEEYKAEVDALYWYKNALDNAEESVDKLNDALKNTDNFNEQEKYIRQLIDATNNQINKTNDLKNAQVGQINNFINQLRQQGFAIDYNAQSNELYINNMQHLSDLTGDAAKNAEKLLDKIQDLNDDNRDLDGSIRDLTADVKDYYEQLEDIPEKKLEKFNDLMEEFQQSYLDQVQYQIEDLEHAMENDERLKALNEQIEALEKQNDEVDKQKEMEEKLLAVEEAKLKLENARKQKNIQIFRERSRMGKKRMPSSIAICCVISNYIG